MIFIQPLQASSVVSHDLTASHASQLETDKPQSLLVKLADVSDCTAEQQKGLLIFEPIPISLHPAKAPYIRQHHLSQCKQRKAD